MFFVTGQYTGRFTGRGGNYAKYRPSYPKEIIVLLTDHFNFNENKVVADIGSGTGLLSKLFLENGNNVFGVEPNDDMRSYAEKDLLPHYKNFTSVNGSAENTGLTEKSIDLITIGQALHWFDPEKSRAEFARILNADGYVLVVYNERKGSGAGEEEESAKGFTGDYDKRIKKYKKNKVPTPEIDDSYLSKLFDGGSYEEFVISNFQLLDFDGLLGRAASASYMPTRNDPDFENMKRDLRELFDLYQKNGRVVMEYVTNLHLGRVSR